MIGGLFKTTSLAALVAAAGIFIGQASPAKAADLGGDCCADLEERVAELEATTVRKGNRKVSVTLSGFVGHQVMWWDDGSQTDTYIGDGGNYGSRFRFVGTAKINPNVTAGFLYEFGINNNAIQNMNQLNGGDDLGAASAPLLRDSTVWIEHKTLGRIKIGHGSTSTDNLVLIDLSGCAGACTPDIALYNGGFLLRANNGSFGTTASASTNPQWQYAIRGHESWDTGRRNHVMYQSPTIGGFQLQAAVAEDNYWDVALRYAGEFGGFRLAAGIGYQEDSDLNRDGVTPITTDTFSANCGTQCNVKTQEWKGVLSVMHVASGLFLTASGGNRQLDGISNAALGGFAGPDVTYWHLIGGISQNWTGIGRTVLFGEYGESSGGLAQAAYLGFMSGHNTVSDNTVTYWGLGLTQHIDAAAMEFFVAYKNYSMDATGFTGGFDGLNSFNSGVADFQTVIVGTRINF